MNDSQQLIAAMDGRVRRRDERREFFRAALGVGAFAVGGAAALNFSTSANAQAIDDPAILNFALNLEYLEAQFYSYAANGVGLPADQLTGTGQQGAVVTGTGAGMARKVNFTDPVVSAYAQEIAADEIAHVKFLRSALGAAAVSQPAIDISGAGAFTAAARAATVADANTVFDPYADDNSFLLGAFIFEDVGVTAYKGASPLISNPTFLEAAAGILAVEAYHASIVRTTLYAKGVDVPALRTNADKISAARDSLDGSSTLDQGISPRTRSGQQLNESNIVPLDDNGIAYSRTAGQVLNIVYLNKAAVTMGGFFPAGVNGTIRASAAN